MSKINKQNEITKILEEAGAKIVNSIFSKKLNLLITGNKKNITNKIEVAKMKNIEIKTFEEVKEEYNL